VSADLFPASRSPVPDRAQFAAPGARYRGAPFWSWNGRLERGRLLEQFDRFAEMGLGGAHLHARTGLDTPYLGDGFMGLVRDCVQHAKEHGQLAWLYDEDRWPSGAAGGLVTRDPALRQRCLLFTPRSYAQDPGDAREGMRVEHGRSGGGPLIGAYALRFADGRLAACRLLRDGEDASAGESAWWAYLETPPPSTWYNHQTYVDVLNPAAIRRFIEITHERYRSVVGEEFGRTVPAIFTDEPSFTTKFQARSADDRRDLYLPWTGDLAATLRAAHGLDIVPHIPWLFFDAVPGGGPEPGVARIRWCWHDHIAERFRTAYAEQIGGWCDTHGLLMTGHLESEADLVSQVCRNGECMRFYQPMQLPAVDMLCDAVELTTVLQARSVARQEGRAGVASELAGVTNWDFTFAGHKRQGDWQAALGVTVRVPHLAWYSMAGEAKRDYPAPIDAHSPWWREYRLVEDHFARLNTCLTRGEARCRVAVLHPVESMWLAFGQADACGEARNALERGFHDLAAWLVHGLIDADYVAESLLWRQRPRAAAGRLHVGACAYEAVLVAGLDTIRSSTLEQLERALDAGVRVLFAGGVPALVDARPSDRAQRLAARCRILALERPAVLAALEDLREVRLRRADGTPAGDGMLHQLRCDGEARWLFACNAARILSGPLPIGVNGDWDADGWDDDAHLQFISAAARQNTGARHLLGLRGEWLAEAWDTTDSSVRSLPVRQAGGWSEVEWLCQDAGHILLRWTPGRCAPPAVVAPPAKQWQALVLPDPTELLRDEPNVLLLDRAAGSLDGGPETAPEEILRLDNAWRERLGWGRITARIAQPWCDGAAPRDHRVRLRWTLRLEVPVRGARLALERLAEATVSLDGQPLALAVDGWWVDEAITTAALPDLAAGTHELVAELPYGRGTVLEWAYLLGDFAVRVQGREAVVCAAPARCSWGDLAGQGLPFYAGNLTYRVPFRHTGSRLRLAAHRFRAPLLRVRLDGDDRGAVAWAPWQADLGEVAAGEHLLEVVCYGDRRNAFGQVHHAAPERHRWWGPDSWRSHGDAWSEEYVLAPHGVLSAPRLLDG
jgi:hypothetical protein